MCSASILAGALAAALCIQAAATPAPDSSLSFGPFAEREGLLAEFDRMPEADLEAYFLRCSRSSSQRMMGFDEAVPCAMSWDALLPRRFGGQVQALLDWWRVHRDDFPSD
jgi:hypothetical protein